MQLIIPDNVRSIITKLQDNGFEAYAVGGCVRDSYLGLEPHDWDITTNALPAQVKSLFRRTIDVGIQHGTVVIMIGDEGYEVTTYRIDGEYEDGRHPKEVTFTASLQEDLRRRDFTINAMAYSDKDGIIDLFGGIEDLNNHIIRAVGDPAERFNEDALRILRAIRFSARFGYDIEEKTRKQISLLASNLQKISAERIREEVEKTLMSDHPDRMCLAYELGITRYILPEWDKMMECDQNSLYHMYSVGMHTIVALNKLVELYSDLDFKDKRICALAVFLHDIAKPLMKTTDEEGLDHFKGHPEKGAEISREVLRRLKYDNDTLHAVEVLVKYHDLRPSLKLPRVRKAIATVGAENIGNLMIVKHVDFLAQSDYKKKERWDYYVGLKSMCESVMTSKDPLCIKDLKVSGRDLIAEGIKPGPQMGEMLNKLLDEVLTDPSVNEKETLLKIVREQV